MRAVVADRSIQLPPLSTWGLAGGAYLDDGDLVIPEAPEVAAAAGFWLHTQGIHDRADLTPYALLTSGVVLLSTAYYKADRKTPAPIGAGGWTGNGFLPRGPAGEWAIASGNPLRGLRAGGVHWVRYSLRIGASYGGRGGRFHPSPAWLSP